MPTPLLTKFAEAFIDWLTRDHEVKDLPRCDFSRICAETRPGDVLLIEGRSRVSEVIKLITLSPWSHACLYIGRIHDVENPVLRERLKAFYDGPPDAQLLIEGMLGKGTVVAPITNYKDDHIRICRPLGLSRHDAQQVIGFGIGKLGIEYNVRQLLDLARFLFPWSILPRRWRSSLFSHRAGETTREICSSLLAEAFRSINYPILPRVQKSPKTGVEFIPRNPRLFTPSDFDYSPYFEIIKYPMFDVVGSSGYRRFPWNKEGLVSNDQPGQITATKPKPTKEKPPQTTTAESPKESPEEPPAKPEKKMGKLKSRLLKGKPKKNNTTSKEKND